MASFIDQIKEDFEEYRMMYPTDKNFQKDEWVFNYWVLDKLYYIDGSCIPEYITDYHDHGIDSWWYDEDTNDMYLIQNKFYAETNKLQLAYVRDEFLVRPDKILKNGAYGRCQELQDTYNKHCGEKNFVLHLVLYITNNLRDDAIRNAVQKYSEENATAQPVIEVEVCYLDDIRDKFFRETKQQKKKFEYEFKTINQSTILNFDRNNYKIKVPIDAKYVLTSVKDLFDMYCRAKKEEYLLFDRNIREFLGSTGINKEIIATLRSSEDRYNFCYYNNGITVNCSKLTKAVAKSNGGNKTASLNIINPQIVNGCQTMNSIYHALKDLPAEKLGEYDDVYVICKFLQINQDDKQEEELYKRIVLYNNSQNAIKLQDFTKNKSVFKRWQDQFLSRGFCLLVKPSDKHKFSEEFKANKFVNLRKKIDKSLDRFGLKFEKVADCFIPLDKLLQVMMAFEKGGHVAYTKKSAVLNESSDIFKFLYERLQSEILTPDILIDLYLLYKKSEEIKRENSKKEGATDIDERCPISYYLIDGFGKYDCISSGKDNVGNRYYGAIKTALDSEEKINDIINKYMLVSRQYIRKYQDYNKTIKRPVDYDVFESAIGFYDDMKKTNII